MKSTPILFTGSMVRALLDGRKTQTRRIVNPQPPPLESLPSGHYFDAYNGGPNWNFWTHDDKMDNRITGPIKDSCQWRCPYGQVGDLLWVRETFLVATDGRPVFRAEIENTCPSDWKWKPSIFMLRKYCRITLEITNIRVERVQEISEKDAQAEGIGLTPGMKPYGWTHIPVARLEDGPIETFESAVEAYQKLWDSINGKTHPWSSNLWVWVVEFSKVVTP